MSTHLLRRLATAGLLCSLGGNLAAQDTAVSVTYPRELRNAATRIERIDRFTEGQGRFEWLEIPAALASARTEAEQYLASHPDDLGALMLLVRVGRIEALFAPTTIRTEAGGWVADTTDHLAPVHALLDRVLALEPRLAEAHYWKARLFATSNPRFDGDSLIVQVDWEACLVNAGRAVQLAPGDTRYRELLALARAQHGDLAGAADAVRNVDRGKNLVYLLLTDLAAVPVPEDAVPLPGVQATFAEMFGQAGLGGYANLRVRAFALPGGASQVEAFYRTTWPEFTLFATTEEEGSRNFVQLLRPTRTGFAPATSDGFIDRDDQPNEGIMVLVTETPGLSETARATYPDDPRLRGPFTQVVTVNYRRK